MIAWFVASHLVSTFTGGGLLKLFLGNLMGDLKAIVAFLKAHSIWLTVSLVLASCWGVDHVISHRHAAKVESQLAKCTKGRADDKAAYVAAQATASAQNKAHVANENKLREQINETSHSDFVSQRDRLRSQSGAAQGSAGTAGVSQVPHAAAGTPPEAVSLPPAELLRAQETELELNALIDWVNAQSAIDPNKP